MSKITNVNKRFPKMEMWNTVSIICPRTYEVLRGCKVIGAWYPEEGDEWNESKEVELMGYLGSDPNKQFPQVRVLIPEKYTHELNLPINAGTRTVAMLFGYDTGSVVSIEKS